MHSLQIIKRTNQAEIDRILAENKGRVCSSEAHINKALAELHDKRAAENLARQSAHLAAQRSAGLPVSA